MSYARGISLYYQLDFSNTRDGRTATYVKRIFYEKKYAAELRLFNIASRLLKRHEEAYEGMYERTRALRKKAAKYESIRWSTFGLMTYILPFLYVAWVVKTREGVNIGAYLAMATSLEFVAGNISDMVEQVVILNKHGLFMGNLREFLEYDSQNEEQGAQKTKLCPISENVLMHSPRNEEECKLVEMALEKAQFGEKLKTLPSGIETMVSKEFDENGVVLSGGEAQKVAISRLFMKGQQLPVAILDEPSSALDPIAEYTLNTNMMNNAKEATIIFISHRLSTTRDADRIYLFEHGQIIEQGTHDELMALNGEYAEMFEKQAYYYKLKIG